MARHSMVVALVLLNTLESAIAGPDCDNANCGDTAACITATFCSSASDCTCGTGDHVETWCVDSDAPGNSFDTGVDATRFIDYGTFAAFCVDVVDPKSPLKAGAGYVSLFSGDYCTGKPIKSDCGSWGSCGSGGVYTFTGGATEINCAHPYWYPHEYDSPTEEQDKQWAGVGIKVALFPGWDMAPYNQITCMDEKYSPGSVCAWGTPACDNAECGYFADGNPQCWNSACASGTDGIACIGTGDDPNADNYYGMDYVFIQTGKGNLDFASAQCRANGYNPADQHVCDFEQDGNGYYPLGSVIVGTIMTPSGDRSYCSESKPDDSGFNFCERQSLDEYNVVIRFKGATGEYNENGENAWNNWCDYDAQAWGDASIWCNSGIAWNLNELTTKRAVDPVVPPPGTALPIRAYWARILKKDTQSSDFECPIPVGRLLRGSF